MHLHVLEWRRPQQRPYLHLTASAPEAVWSEVVALQEVVVKQLLSLEPPMGPEALQEVVVKQLLSLEPPMGPEAPIFAEPLGPEVVVALEPEEQLPELPLTPD
jgi:hypothetical protein